MRIKHMLKTHWLLQANEHMSEAQKQRIEATPFKYLLQLPEKMEVSCPLLFEMLGRWDEEKCGFKVGSTVVVLTPLDVCFALGLRIVGKNIKLETGEVEKESHTRRLVQKETKVDGISDLLLLHSGPEQPVDDYCRLYLLLVFAGFLMPKTTESINEELYKYVDDLDTLDEYAWGIIVYHYLVVGLNRASRRLHEEKNSREINITGCVAVLQV